MWKRILIAVIGISPLSIKLPVNRFAARFLRPVSKFCR